MPAVDEAAPHGLARAAPRAVPLPHPERGVAAGLRRRHRVPRHDLRGDPQPEGPRARAGPHVVYGMVGNSQFRNLWLDEAFASWAEAVVDQGEGWCTGRDGPARAGGRIHGRLRRPGAYRGLVYDKGGDALLAAREAARSEAFDAAIRCYVDSKAWSIATPADVGGALAGLPAARRPRPGPGPGRGRRAEVRAPAAPSRGSPEPATEVGDEVLSRRIRAAAACG